MSATFVDPSSGLILPSSMRNTRSQDLGPETFIYYENKQGRLFIPVNPADRAVHARLWNQGYERREARSVQAAEKVSARFRKQMQDDRAKMSADKRAKIDHAESVLRDRLRMRMAQSGCTQYERDVIRAYLQRMDDGALRKKDVQWDGYLHAEGHEKGH